MAAQHGMAAAQHSTAMPLQDQLLAEPGPVLLAIHGLLEHVRRHVFAAGGPETILTVVHVDRAVGFRLAWSAMPLRAVQRLVGALQELYPNYTQRILIVNLPAYLMWFVRFVKGLLCEVTANKLELVADEATLATFFTPDGLPAIYRDASPARGPADRCTHAQHPCMTADSPVSNSSSSGRTKPERLIENRVLRSTAVLG
jgi:hypothetical protein